MTRESNCPFKRGFSGASAWVMMLTLFGAVLLSSCRFGKKAGLRADAGNDVGLPPASGSSSSPIIENGTGGEGATAPGPTLPGVHGDSEGATNHDTAPSEVKSAESDTRAESAPPAPSGHSDASTPPAPPTGVTPEPAKTRTDALPTLDFEDIPQVKSSELKKGILPSNGDGHTLALGDTFSFDIEALQERALADDLRKAKSLGKATESASSQATAERGATPPPPAPLDLWKPPSFTLPSPSSTQSCADGVCRRSLLTSKESTK